jgi:hypothetical protein
MVSKKQKRILCDLSNGPYRSTLFVDEYEQTWFSHVEAKE